MIIIEPFIFIQRARTNALLALSLACVSKDPENVIDWQIVWWKVNDIHTYLRPPVNQANNTRE